MGIDSEGRGYLSYPRIGCAGWSVPRSESARFPAAGSHLERYAQRFSAVEVNSSFYRPHKPATYERWASSVPDGFCFSVKVPKEITHRLRLKAAEAPLQSFLAECRHLGPKLGPLLVQLPPGLAFASRLAGSFFSELRGLHSGDVACEPRHPSWFAPEPDRLLDSFQVGRVAADPAVVPAAAEPGGWGSLVYYRLHGSPRIYYSAYPPDFLGSVARKLADFASSGARTWCIFDNTAEGAAAGDALSVLSEVEDLLHRD